MFGQRNPSQDTFPHSQNIPSTSFMGVNQNGYVNTEESLPGYQMNQFNPITNTLAKDFMMNGQSLQNSFSDALPMGARTYYNSNNTFVSTKLQGAATLPRQIHCCMLFFNLLFYAMVIGAMTIVVVLNIPIWSVAQMIGIPYLLYLVYSLCLNPFTVFHNNMKNFDEMQGIYNQLKQRTGHIKLTAECYHMTGGKRKRRVITHSAVEMIPVRQCIDESQNLGNLRNMGSYVLGKIQRCYYFGDNNSNAAFQNIMATFRANNKKDTHQVYSHILDMTIPGFLDTIGACQSGSAGHIRPLFVLFTIFGLGYPFTILIECMTKRCQINCVKRLTL